MKHTTESWIDLGDLANSDSLKEDITELFEEDLVENLEAARFSQYSKMYPLATENLAGYFPPIDMEGKTVLTVSASGDHVINSYLFGAEEVVAFDSNILSGLFCELKSVALNRLDLKEFKRFFLLGDDVFDFEVYQSLRKYLSPVSRLFFDKALEYFDRDGAVFRRSKAFKNDPTNLPQRSIDNNPYLQSHIEYQHAKNQHRITRWHLKRLEALHDLPEESVDIILLSNIADYAPMMFPERQDYLKAFAETILAPMKKILSPAGKICAAYVYDARLNNSGENQKYRTDIDNPNKRRALLSSLGMKYQELFIRSVIPGKSDAVIILKK